MNETKEDSINPCPPEWLDNKDNALLRGDAIGDTVYTHRWILKCLFTITESLSRYTNKNGSEKESDTTETKEESKDKKDAASTKEKEADLEDELNKDSITCDAENENKVIELDADVEDAACQLWDMTMERDVSLHLLNLEEVDVLQLAGFIFDESCAPRLTEVMIGVVANLCCMEEGCEKILRKDKHEVLLSVLRLLGSTSDVPTLCEVLRLIRLLIWHRTNRTPNTTWASCPLLKLLCLDVYRNAITFFLNNSLSDGLISGLLNLLSNFLFICLPETGLNVASLYSTEDLIKSLVDMLERKSSQVQKHQDKEQEEIIHMTVMCLYAFIDTPGEKLIQLCGSVEGSKLEHVLLYYLEHEGRVETLEQLVGEVCDHVIRVTGLLQLLIPYMKRPTQILTVGKLLALLHGQTHQYSVSRSSSREDGRHSSRPTREGRRNSKNSTEEELHDYRSSRDAGRRSSLDDVLSASASDSVKRMRRKSKEYKTQYSNPLIEECGWVSPPAEPSGERNTFHPGPSDISAAESSQWDEPSHERHRLDSSSDLSTLKDLEDVLEDYCYQLLAFWWSLSEVRSKREETQKNILDILDQCHAHEALFFLQAVRGKDPTLVPKLQEQIIDTGNHQRLVMLLAHLYQ